MCVVLQGAEFNPQKAIKETLQKSERTKNLINTRAADGNKQSCFLILIPKSRQYLITFVLGGRIHRLGPRPPTNPVFPISTCDAVLFS